MNRKVCSSIITTLILLSIIAAPALAVSVSYSARGSQGTVTSAGNFALDKSTSLKEKTVISGGGLYQDRQASGSGENSLTQIVAGSGYSVDSSVGSSGSLSTATSTAASGSGALLDQTVSGSGSSGVSLHGRAGASSAGQEAGVLNGAISTSLSLVARNSIVANQRTQMAGEAGIIGSSSDSNANTAVVAGAFSGSSNLNADLISAASERAATTGTTYVAGVEVVDDNVLGIVSSGDIGMSVEGLYSLPGSSADTGIGKFSIVAVNKKKSSEVSSDVLPAIISGGKRGSSSGSSRGSTIGSTPTSGSSTTNSILTGPKYTSDGGRSSAYVFAGWRWNTRNPQIKMNVKDDANLRNEGLTAANVATAVNSAANAWDDCTNQNLFSDSGVGITTASADTCDRVNTVAFKSFPSNLAGALAYTRTWYSYTKVGGYYSATESDISFNTKYGWSTSGIRNYDVKTTTMHELGHTIGLGDLYGKSQFSSDTRQIMHYYSGIKTLGNGDKNGAWILYS